MYCNGKIFNKVVYCLLCIYVFIICLLCCPTGLLYACTNKKEVLLAGFSLRVTLSLQVKIVLSIPVKPFISPLPVFSRHHLNGLLLLTHIPFSTIPPHHTSFCVGSFLFAAKARKRSNHRRFFSGLVSD